ncbi:MAG TPA: hypothetical protein VIL36_19770 [Acidimicrobiales bacterium]
MAQVRITAKRQLMQFLITKPARVEVDGRPAGEVRWNQTLTFEVPAGTHTLTMSFPYLGRQRTGEASTTLQLADGQAVDVLYRTPWIVTMKGSFKVTPAAVPTHPGHPGQPG